jgi:lactoylglutathione lyase
MKIHHLAIWCNNLEKMKTFYLTYFKCSAGNLYENKSKGFKSYFISFDEGSKIELMNRRKRGYANSKIGN